MFLFCKTKIINPRPKLSNFATQFKSKKDFIFNQLQIKSLRLIIGEAMQLKFNVIVVMFN
jgi:hypothetical protein